MKKDGKLPCETKRGSFPSGVGRSGFFSLPMVIVMMVGVRVYDTGSEAGGDDQAYEDEADPSGCFLVHDSDFKFHQ